MRANVPIRIAPGSSVCHDQAMAHPVPWQNSIEPGSLDSLTTVQRGARSTGSVADALVLHDADEQARRVASCLGAVPSLALLDTLLNLPVGVPTRRDDVSPYSRELLWRAPLGVVELDGLWVTRLLTPPLTVVAAVVRSVPWRRAIQRAGRFAPFAQRIMVFDVVPSPELTWEANAVGVGVWAIVDGKTHELCRPAPFVRAYWKAAGWRFAEHAYATWLTSTPRPDLLRGIEGHLARTETAGSGQR
jgi:hypothetical protein